MHLSAVRSPLAVAVMISTSLWLSACNDESTNSNPDPDTDTPITCSAPEVLNDDGTACELPDEPVASCESPIGDEALYLLGGPNGWQANYEYEFAHVCGGRYELVTSIPGSQTFKFGSEGWSPYDWGAAAGTSTPILNESFALAPSGGNISYTFDDTNRLVLDLSESVDNPTLTVESCVPAPFEEDLFLRGGLNGWAASAESQFQYACDAYYLNVSYTGASEFKVADENWAADTTFGGATGNTTVSFDSDFSLMSNTVTEGGDAPNLSFQFEGDYTFKITFDENGENPVLNVGEQTFIDRTIPPVTDELALSVRYDSRDETFNTLRAVPKAKSQLCVDSRCWSDQCHTGH
ncbi:hypothetical protein [Reinekea blandensis]|uniref:Putative pullulanase n=1 Tax=Reinekea blandensis MED297 TaxID=314283 RepID=A4BFK7_9GAMM|nr:hypothetical protein [Reinekea blandensis]EAR09102.1 putative pullulanase precursor [Reinekea sp. MED297] [Reinekea blandensis MED297]